MVKKERTFLIPVEPGAYIYTTYVGNWTSVDWPTEYGEITVEVEKFPVVALFCTVPVNDDGNPTVSPVILSGYGWVEITEPTPLDFGEESVHLGMYPKTIEDSELNEKARQRCWNRCNQNRRNEERSNG